MKCPCCGGNVSGYSPELAIDSIGLGPSEKPIARLLTKRFGQYVNTSELIGALYSGVKDGGPETARNVVNVLVHNIRKKYKPYGITIEKGGWNTRRMIWITEK